MDTDPPFRNFTTRLYAKLLVDMHPPNQKLQSYQYKKLISAYKNSIYQLKRVNYQIDPENIYSPYYFFLELIKSETKKFVTIESNVEFNRLLA